MVTIKAARNRAVPLVAIETADPAQTVRNILADFNGGAKFPVMRWDIVRAIQGINAAGTQAVGALMNGRSEGELCNPTEMLKALVNAPERSVTFMLNAHLYWTNEMVLQAIWNLRDQYKSTGTMLVMLAQTTSTLPEELKNDVVLLEDSLPSDAELDTLVRQLLKDGEVEKADVPLIKDALLGLSGFGAENNLALSIEKGVKVDMPTLTQRQIRAINATKGLSVYRGTETLKDLAGMKNAVTVFSRILKGMGYRALAFVDEIDKGMAGSRTDTSGVSQDQLKAFLSYMQDNEVLGGLLLGPPGTGKTFLCKVLANEHGIPLIMVDLGAAKGSLVGQSEQTIRQMLKVIHSITGGKVLFIGACNRTDTLPPELRRRFNFLSMFCDLADEEEKAAAWAVYTKKYDVSLTAAAEVNDANWTAAEIKNCCLKASVMGCTPVEAAMTVVPIAVSAADEVTALRRSASGKYTAASHEGLYYYSEQPQETTTRRRIEKEG